MYRYFLALALTGALSACGEEGGNPLLSGDPVAQCPQPLTECEPASGGGTDAPDPVADQLFASDFSDDLTANAVTYDPATNEVRINNLPFDGDDNIYAADAAATAALSGTQFGAYRNVAGSNQYYAVFRRTASGYGQAMAVGGDSYLSFGYGGAAAQRLNGDGALPSANGTYVFNGEYAAVRTVIDTSVDPSQSRVQYVAGTVQLDVDIRDFDNIGAVEGVVVNRTFFDNNGVRLNELDGVNYISLATTNINFDSWSINAGSAQVVASAPGLTGSATGDWQGLFTGPNGEEIAGIVVVDGTGPIGVDPGTGDFIEVQTRETGGFVAARP
ncbi:hypothetical protein [Thetidibacter halocola]|uniref:Uncharacterized protein n=1 Tax=Thetidibacter halocola TaxID=2827239 RepID=A0A8J8BA46_9RHOB|nr:hypothetical protein [Thetidibacter halocola]MBS0124818.1 hypothetical protein [Thetidibacter halocola]